jgi:hypothetical protein
VSRDDPYHLSVEIFEGGNKNNQDRFVASYTLALATTEKANSDDMNTVDGESSNSDDIQTWMEITSKCYQLELKCSER